MRTKASSVVFLLAAWGCAAAPPAPVKALPTETATPTATAVATSSAIPTATTAPSAIAPLPPPKSTTLSLASNADSPADRALVAGDRAFDEGDFDAAAKNYAAARATAPAKPGPLVGLARVRVARTGLPMDYASGKGNPEILASVRDLRKATQMDPTFGPALVELGRALLLAGDADGAVATLRKGVTLMVDEAEAHSVLGVALLATGHRDEALVELTRAASLDPGSAARHGNLGTVLFMNGRVADAVKEYELQVRLEGDDARAHSDLGTALLASEDATRAIAELRRAIAIDPSHAAFHSNLGYAMQSQGMRSEAIAEYREALRLDSQLSSAWINLATILAHDPKSRAEARAALETAKKIDPSDPRVKANLEELDSLERGAPP